MVDFDEEELKKLGIYKIECEPGTDDWIHVKMKVPVKFWLKHLFRKYISFWLKIKNK